MLTTYTKYTLKVAKPSDVTNTDNKTTETASREGKQHADILKIGHPTCHDPATAVQRSQDKGKFGFVNPINTAV
jgi:hypothetical protein